MVRLAAAAAALLLLGPASVSAALPGCTDPGSSLPVVLVHGFSGSPDDFDELDRVLSSQANVATTRFDYRGHNLEWVTHDRIAPSLARLVDCLADRSEGAGGPGKVAVVAHSMGGLAVREASSQVGERLAIVVTIGTPHEGSYVAGPNGESLPGALGRTVVESLLDHACRFAERSSGSLWAPSCALAQKVGSPAAEALTEGSSELADLPPFPTDVPVLAIAGQVTLVSSLLGWENRLSLFGDAMVGEGSATAHHAQPEAGGGSHVERCNLDIAPFRDTDGELRWSGSECVHGGLLENREVMDRVVEALSA